MTKFEEIYGDTVEKWALQFNEGTDLFNNIAGTLLLDQCKRRVDGCDLLMLASELHEYLLKEAIKAERNKTIGCLNTLPDILMSDIDINEEYREHYSEIDSETGLYLIPVVYKHDIAKLINNLEA